MLNRVSICINFISGVFMGELENKLVELLKIKKVGMSTEEIAEETGIAHEIIKQAIENLERDGKIFRGKKDKFVPWDSKGLGRIFGTIRITRKGGGILTDEEGNVTFVHHDFLNGALPGDKVIVGNLKTVKKRQEGRVERVLDRYNDKVVCEVTNLAGHKLLLPVSRNDSLSIKISNDDLKDYFEGDRLVVSIGLEKDGKQYLGKVVKKICNKYDPNSELITIAAVHGFDFEFPKEVIAEVKEIPQYISEEEKKNRVDLRDKLIFTIDGEDTKDIDDAISLEILPNGNYLLGVHIADVAHYVKKDSAIYEEALKRGTSVYMLNTVIPMLPRELSNGICSLNEGEERLAKTCEIELDKKGNIINSRVYDSIIKSKKKMSYEAVNKILEEGIVTKGYEPFVDALMKMYILSEVLEKRKNRRGALQFEKKEMKIKMNDRNKISEVEAFKPQAGETLIENFMLAANQVVASIYATKKMPFIYRVHGAPNVGNLYKTYNTISHINNHIEIPEFDIASSKVVQKFLDEMRETKEYPAFSDMILRSMSRAVYSSENDGHYGLALNNYTHFTSPIRRFPDLLVHQLINLYAKGKDPSIDNGDLENRIAEIASKSSLSEYEAQNAEYDAIYMKTAEYMENHIGEVYEGTIMGVNERGMSVVLDNLIKGYVNIGDSEPKRFYDFDKQHLCLRDEDGKELYLGDRILLRVKSASKEKSSINFTSMGLVNANSHDKVKIKNLTPRQK